MNSEFVIAQASLENEVASVRELFREYAAGLRIDLCFQNFSSELAALPGLYAPPTGRLLLASIAQSPAGCAALRPLNANDCEMKRLYVRPQFRRAGLGRKLTERIISEARQIGFAKMKLDTLPSMTDAIELYGSLGFYRCAKYYDAAPEHLVFMELKLQ
ncbi:MAG TPA: GNAT family N-acetyltransferase [Verrucomicrobiae bacterium]